MKLLTFENAEKLLKFGEIYRIGYNALNQGEFLYEHKDIRNYDYSLWNQDKLNQEEIKKDFVLHGKMNFFDREKKNGWILKIDYPLFMENHLENGMGNHYSFLMTMKDLKIFQWGKTYEQ